MGPAPRRRWDSEQLSAQYLGGRLGTTRRRALTSTITVPSARPPEQQGIALASVQPRSRSQAMALALGQGRGRRSRSRMTPDEAIARRPGKARSAVEVLRDSPGTADVLQAGLRANPVFYADGSFCRTASSTDRTRAVRPEYDVNISAPCRPERQTAGGYGLRSAPSVVLEAQYQDAARQMIDNVYSAYVDDAAAAGDPLLGKPPPIPSRRL